MDKVERSVNWYLTNRKVYEEISTRVKTLLEELIRSKGLNYLSVTSRAKTVDSFSDKAKKDKYSDPESEIKDLSGIRVIAYVESDVAKICKLIEKEFVIDPANSVNKSEILKVNEVGYRSVHYVARLSDNRLDLFEFQRFLDVYFEIQVRTILQHAWAEIEHDRNYKFSGILPESNEIQRRFSLLSGLLEVSDREFDNLVRDLDGYAAKVSESTKKGDLEIPLDSISLREYIITRYEQAELEVSESVLIYSEDKVAKSLIKELNNFGIESILDIDKILSQELFIKIHDTIPESSIVGFMRSMMIVVDADRYFNNSWSKKFRINNPTLVKVLSAFDIPLERLIEKYSIEQQT